MPNISNAFPPRLGERTRHGDSGSRRTPSDGASFDKYLNEANAAPPVQTGRRPDRAERPAGAAAASGRHPSATQDKQPAGTDEDDSDRAPAVDGPTDASGGDAAPPLPICLAPQSNTPVSVEPPVGPPIPICPKADPPDTTAKEKAAAEWGEGPLHAGPGARPASDPETPLDPPICTGGPGSPAVVHKLEGPVQDPKDPLPVAPEPVESDGVDESKPQPKSESPKAAREPVASSEIPAAPEQRTTPLWELRTGRPNLKAEDTADEPKTGVVRESGRGEESRDADRTPPPVKPASGQHPTARLPERGESPVSTKADAPWDEAAQRVAAETPVDSLAPGRGEAVNGTNPAAEIGRFLFPAIAAPQSAPAGASTRVDPGAGHAEILRESAASGPNVSATDVATPADGGDANIERLVKVLSGSRGESNWRVALQLDPPELGRLHIHARMEDGGLSLNVAADSESVRRTIESRIGELRDALSDHGIRLDAADVRVRPSSEAGNGATREQATGGQGESPARGFSQGQSSQGQSSHWGDGGSWQTPSGFGKSYGDESRQSQSGWSGLMGLADVASTSETSVDLVA